MEVEEEEWINELVTYSHGTKTFPQLSSISNLLLPFVNTWDNSKTRDDWDNGIQGFFWNHIIRMRHLERSPRTPRMRQADRSLSIVLSQDNNLEFAQQVLNLRESSKTTNQKRFQAPLRFLMMQHGTSLWTAIYHYHIHPMSVEEFMWQFRLFPPRQDYAPSEREIRKLDRDDLIYRISLLSPQEKIQLEARVQELKDWIRYWPGIK